MYNNNTWMLGLGEAVETEKYKSMAKSVDVHWRIRRTDPKNNMLDYWETTLAGQRLMGMNCSDTSHRWFIRWEGKEYSDSHQSERLTDKRNI